MTKTSKKTTNRRSTRLESHTRAPQAKPLNKPGSPDANTKKTTTSKSTKSTSTKKRTPQAQELRKAPGSPKKKSKVISTPDDEPVESYLDAAVRLPAPTVWPHQSTDSFVMAKQVKENPPNQSPDDDTQSGKGNRSIPLHLFASMLVSLEKNPEAPQSEAPLSTIDRANQMLKPLLNKFPKKVWIAPWMLPEDKIADKCLLASIEAESNESLLDLAEKYLHDFNRFQSWGRRTYMRLHIVYHPSIQEDQLLAQMSLCSIKGEGGQFFQKAHSDAKDPIAGGTLTGSVPTMAESPDFYHTFKQKWQFKSLGLYWSFMRSKNGGTYTNKKSVLHIEIDRCDQNKLEEVRAFFNQKSTAVTDQFWGTPMQWVPTWDYKLSDSDNDKVERHKDSQYKLGMSLRSCTIFGINPYNLLSKTPYKTLHRAMMEIESVYTKYIEKVTHNSNSLPTKSKKEFKGRLFYAIIPSTASQKLTFHYTTANSDEANSVARAIPHFIRSHFKVDATHFCNNELIAATRDGHWDATKRMYLSEEDLIENNKLEDLESSMMAVKEVYIDPSHQRALAADGDSVQTSDTRLTRGDASAIPLNDNNSNTSSLTGSTRVSKVKRAVEQVSKQHLGTINSMKSKMDSLTDLLHQHGIEFPASNDTVANDHLHLDLTNQSSLSSEEASEFSTEEVDQILHDEAEDTSPTATSDTIHLDGSNASAHDKSDAAVDSSASEDDSDMDNGTDNDDYSSTPISATPSPSNDQDTGQSRNSDRRPPSNTLTTSTTTEGLGSGDSP